MADQRLREIKESGVNLFACAYGAQKRNLTGGNLATFAGLVATIVTVPVYVPTPKPAGFAVTVMFEGVGPVAVLIRSQFAAGFVPAVA